MKTKIPYIVAFVSAAALLVLQWMWTDSEYHATEQRLQETCNKYFEASVLEEAYLRIESLSPVREGTIGLHADFELEENFRTDEYIPSAINVVMQEFIDSVFHEPVSLPVLDSLFAANLREQGFAAEVFCCVVDTAGTVVRLREDKALPPASGILKTKIMLLDREGTAGLQATVVNPAWLVLRDMRLKLAASGLMCLLCLASFVFMARLFVSCHKKG